MQVLGHKSIQEAITKHLSTYGIVLTAIQQEELTDIVDSYLDDVGASFFKCGYCDLPTTQAQGIWEELNDDISFWICEQCYLVGIDSVK